MVYIQLLFIIIIFLILVNFAWAGLSAAPWVPARKKDFQRVLALAAIKPGEIIYDLGCGDGRWLFYFSKNSLAKEIRGYEISILMYLTSWIKKVFNRQARVKIFFQNIYQVDLKPADVVFCFLTPRAMAKLAPKFLSEMKQGARLISYAFSLPGKTPVRASKLRAKDITVYLYQF